MKFIDLFAGIGGFRLGMTAAGHQCVGFVEWDKYARQSYQAIHDTEGEWTAHDITTVTNDDLRLLGEQYGPIDVITGGFPCQAFSVAGKQLGFDDTRGTLFFEIARFASILKPKYLFLENVKGLLSHDEGNTFATILSALDELGYDAEWQVCNSKDFGVPQNRERVFIIGHLRGAGGREVFPVTGENGEVAAELKMIGMLDMKGNETIRRVYDPTGLCPTLTTMAGGHREPKIRVVGNLNPSGNGMNGNVFHEDGLAPTLTTNKGEGPKVAVSAILTPDREEKRQNGRRMKEPGEPMFTLTAQDRHGVSDGYRIRKLSPRECFRLQGFPDWAFDRAQAAGVSDSQLYRQSGNSVTINVIYAIARRLF